MRAKRAKQYRKLMNAYALSFGFRSPLQVLLDADIIRDASRFKMKLGSMLESTLGGYEIKPMITQCCIRHLYDAPVTNDTEKREKESWIEVAKQAERRRCGHHELENPLTAAECLESVVDPKGNGTNKHRYVVASQDPDIRADMRSIPGVPIVYINRSVMILEPMSASTDQARQAEEKSKIRAGLKTRRGAEVGIKRKRDDDEDRGNEEPSGDGGENLKAVKRNRVKGPKGPNPLSVKKSKRAKSVVKTNEAERSIVRNGVNEDGVAGAASSEKATADGNDTSKIVVDGPKKRKRKRKPKESDGLEADVTGDVNSE